MVGRFAAEAGRAVEAGVREAKAAGARAVGTEHMLLGLYDVPGEACRILPIARNDDVLPPVPGAKGGNALPQQHQQSGKQRKVKRQCCQQRPDGGQRILRAEKGTVDRERQQH